MFAIQNRVLGALVALLIAAAGVLETGREPATGCEPAAAAAPSPSAATATAAAGRPAVSATSAAPVS